jgi:3-deoxy-D-manno-octulosonate 8-phosphate phosphatase (KDO 8-P phosphatase)
LNNSIKNIKLIISDVDGVWTDGSFYKGTDGIEFKKFSVHDGVGVAMARAAKLKVAFISGRYSDATKFRADELKIEDVYNGGLNKIPAYQELKEKYQLEDAEIAYLGDDLIDIPVMNMVGFPIAVSNAIKEVKDISVYITEKCGGEGAFREAVDWIISGQNIKKAVLKKMKERVLSI